MYIYFIWGIIHTYYILFFILDQSKIIILVLIA